MDTGLDALKTAFKKVAHKAGKFLGNKVADAATKSNNDKIVKFDENPGNVEEIIIPLEKRGEILNELRKYPKQLTAEQLIKPNGFRLNVLA